jgi:glucosamine--fructose-6-phosphate aminotransferase (isomerizing)
VNSNQPQYASFTEISSQPEAWEQLIPLVLNKSEALRGIFTDIDEVIFTGCGSGLNASLAGAPVFMAKTARLARALPAFDVYKFPESVINKKRKTLAILSSRSGKTTEVINALNYLKGMSFPTIGITCTAGSPLDLESNLSLVLSPVIERAVITTRSLTGMILVMHLIAAIIANDQIYLAELQRLPEIGKHNIQAFHTLGKTIGERTNLTNYAFLSNSPFFGIAHEAQLKIKEMVLLPVDCYPTLDFRHGPQSNVGEHMLVTVFCSDSAISEEATFLKDMKALGGVTWAICERATPELTSNADYLLEVHSGLSQYGRGILYLPAVQYMAYYRAIALGMSPDDPHNLEYWIDTSG